MKNILQGATSILSIICFPVIVFLLLQHPNFQDFDIDSRLKNVHMQLKSIQVMLSRSQSSAYHSSDMNHLSTSVCDTLKPSKYVKVLNDDDLVNHDPSQSRFFFPYTIYRSGG